MYESESSISNSTWRMTEYSTDAREAGLSPPLIFYLPSSQRRTGNYRGRVLDNLEYHRRCDRQVEQRDLPILANRPHPRSIHIGDDRYLRHLCRAVVAVLATILLVSKYEMYGVLVRRGCISKLENQQESSDIPPALKLPPPLRLRSLPGIQQPFPVSSQSLFADTDIPVLLLLILTLRLNIYAGIYLVNNLVVCIQTCSTGKIDLFAGFAFSTSR